MEIYKFYAMVIMLVETIFIFFSIKYYNDEKYGMYYQLLGVLSGIVTFTAILFCAGAR